VVALGVWGLFVVGALIVGRMTGQSIPTCMLRRVTGIPCATCGSTRGVLALLGGDVVQAFAFNPLIMTLITTAPVTILWWRRRQRRGERLSSRGRVIAWIVAVLLVAGNWSYVLWHEAKLEREAAAREVERGAHDAGARGMMERAREAREGGR
jgi:hypothetical protein